MEENQIEVNNTTEKKEKLGGEYYKKLIENTKIAENTNFLQKSEYRDKFDGSRLYNK